MLHCELKTTTFNSPICNTIKSLLYERFVKVLFPLSLRERVGVRDSKCPVIADVSLLLTSSLREEEQGKIDFSALSQRFLHERTIV